MKALATKALAFVVAYYKRNPVRVYGYLATAVVFVANLVGIAVKVESVQAAIAVIIPIIVAVEASHRKVTPAAK